MWSVVIFALEWLVIFYVDVVGFGILFVSWDSWWYLNFEIVISRLGYSCCCFWLVLLRSMFVCLGVCTIGVVMFSLSFRDWFEPM